MAGSGGLCTFGPRSQQCGWLVKDVYEGVARINGADVDAVIEVCELGHQVVFPMKVEGTPIQSNVFDINQQKDNPNA